MSYNFKNLVFEGGGVKGLAYIGAYKVLEERKILDNVERVAGSSVGAIMALLVGLGHTQSEIDKILSEISELTKFLDDDFGVFRDMYRIIKDYGLYKGDTFSLWLGDILENKGFSREATFYDLYNSSHAMTPKDMYFIGSNLSTGGFEVYCASKRPNMSVVKAVRISMSIPLFFKSIKDDNGDILVDGGVLNNYPIRIFDSTEYSHNYCIPEYYKKLNTDCQLKDSLLIYNKETLGFRLQRTGEVDLFRSTNNIPRREINNLREYLKALINTKIDAPTHLNSYDKHRTVYIDDMGVDAIDFSISDEKKQELIKSGEDNTLKYFEWYDGSNDGSNNSNESMSVKPLNK